MNVQYIDKFDHVFVDIFAKENSRLDNLRMWFLVRKLQAKGGKALPPFDKNNIVVAFQGTSLTEIKKKLSGIKERRQKGPISQ